LIQTAHHVSYYGKGEKDKIKRGEKEGGKEKRKRRKRKERKERNMICFIGFIYYLFLTYYSHSV
jgi:hypothetical protein